MIYNYLEEEIVQFTHTAKTIQHTNDNDINNISDFYSVIKLFFSLVYWLNPKRELVVCSKLKLFADYYLGQNVDKTICCALIRSYNHFLLFKQINLITIVKLV